MEWEVNSLVPGRVVRLVAQMIPLSLDTCAEVVIMHLHIKEGSWVEVTAKVVSENRTEYQGVGIVLYASDVKECEPLKEEMVYFN